jgi:hypothetical protein
LSADEICKGTRVHVAHGDCRIGYIKSGSEISVISGNIFYDKRDITMEDVSAVTTFRGSLYQGNTLIYSKSASKGVHIAPRSDTKPQTRVSSALDESDSIIELEEFDPTQAQSKEAERIDPSKPLRLI